MLAFFAPAACALEAQLGAPRERDGYVWVDLSLSDLFPPRVAESLARGMPATLQLHAELWRRRSGWFDGLEQSYDASARMRYEVWSESYRVDRAGASSLRLSSLDSLRLVLSRPLALPVGRFEQLEPRQRYYIVVTSTLKPLSVEDVAEVEGWLSGEVRDQGRSRFGVITELPRSVFDAVRNFAGFGDQKARALSRDFTRADLRPARR
jgi:hypothetical protein